MAFHPVDRISRARVRSRVENLREQRKKQCAVLPSDEVFAAIPAGCRTPGQNRMPPSRTGAEPEDSQLNIPRARTEISPGTKKWLPARYRTQPRRIPRRPVVQRRLLARSQFSARVCHCRLKRANADWEPDS